MTMSRTSGLMGVALLLDVSFEIPAEFGGSTPPWSAFGFSLF